MKATLLVALLSTTLLYAQNGQDQMNGQKKPMAQDQQMNGQKKPMDQDQQMNGQKKTNGQDHQMNGQKKNGSEKPSNGKLVWQENYDQALSMAQKDNKPLILYFTGSDWCGWCKKMDQEVFSSPAFAQQVGNKFVFVKVDFPMNSKLPEAQARQNAQLKQRYGVTGYPTVVIVDSKGGFIGETGYRTGGGKAYADWLEQFLVSKQ